MKCIAVIFTVFAVLVHFSGCGRTDGVSDGGSTRSSSDIVSASDQSETSDSNNIEQQQTDTVSDRLFYRYHVENAVWDEDEAIFPADWISAAKAIVDAKNENCNSTFTRGWQYDFDGDGRLEAILLFYGYKDEKMIFMDGDSSFIYINSGGEAHFLTTGCDESYDDWRKMDIQILCYTDFNHILLRTGNQTAAGGSYSIVYQFVDDALERIFGDSWVNLDNDVFIETAGPQGHGTDFYFWDTLNNRYSAIGPLEVSPDDFLQLFDPQRINLEANWNYAAPEALDEYSIDPTQYSSEQIERIESYGNRYYQLYFTEAYAQEHDGHVAMTWYRKSDGAWELFWGPYRGFFNSIGFGVDKDLMVYDVDMDAAEKDAL